MPYLIDGHNLVPKLGLKLSDPEDEIQAILKVQEYCRLTRTKAEIYFDGAVPGQPARRGYGLVTAYFVRIHSSADDAIAGRLKKLGRDARNWKVVSSDHQVQASARGMHSQVVSSDEFARSINLAVAGSSKKVEMAPDLSQQEVEDWLNLFKNSKKDL